MGKSTPKTGRLMNPEPLLYDVFCGAGGCTAGYKRAGFRVIGIDNRPQPHYIGDDFILMDAFEFFERYMAGEYERAVAFHTSPPCQGYSVETPMEYRANHPKLITQTREVLQATGKPYVIENVPNARRYMICPLMLCGSMFGLRVWRHRYFEVWPQIPIMTMTCNHSNIPVLVTGTPRRKGQRRIDPSANLKREAVGIDWMVTKELDNAIPPKYTEFIGHQLIQAIENTKESR